MIRVQHLTKTFGDFTAVNDVSFEIAAGEIAAFLGPNGAGKTTTIKMLTTLLKPTSGRIEIDGLNPDEQPNEVRRRFGIVFQDPSLDDELTAQENMEMHGTLWQLSVFQDTALSSCEFSLKAASPLSHKDSLNR